MPRNGSGTASIPNTFTPLTTAVAEDVNENFSDIATMITDSLPRDGQAGMSGQFLATSGTVTEPGIAFNADPNTGFRRPEGDSIAAVCGGSDVATFDSTGVSVSTAPTAGANLANKTYVDAQVSTRGAPTGAVTMFADDAAPTGWLECNGAAVSRTTYAALFAVIGTTWGTGDGSTTFNVPDLRGEFVRGWDHGKGTDSGRAFASSQSDVIKEHVHPVPANSVSIQTTRSTSSSTENLYRGGAIDETEVYTIPATTTSNNTGGSSVETRPRNIALMFIIKT